jgi:hypothetical protein
MYVYSDPICQLVQYIILELKRVYSKCRLAIGNIKIALCYCFNYFSYLGIRYIHKVCYLSSPLVHTPQMDMHMYIQIPFAN